MSRYVVEKTLGTGGMATVELAEDTQLGRKVAVKRLFASLVEDDVLQKRFFREARSAAALSHPNLVAVYDVGKEGDLPYIVMEYVEGETLAALLTRTGPMELERAVDLLLQVCAGLEHAHSAGLVHRDIKPQNLLVRGDGVVKIVDFGIARMVEATQLTETGTVLGTAAYLAPEQAAGDAVTAAADIYSLGAVAYELLSGRTPYELKSLADLTLEQRRSPLPLDGVPPELERAVFHALAFEPADRPRSARAFAGELAGPEPTAITEEIAAPRRLSIPRRAMLAIAALVLAALVAGGLLLTFDRNDGNPPPPQPPPRSDVLPRGDTPAESARLLAEWLRERSS